MNGTDDKVTDTFSDGSASPKTGAILKKDIGCWSLLEGGIACFASVESH